MRRSNNPNTIRNRLWREANPEKVKARKIIDAYDLLLKKGVIDGERVLYNPRKH